jgi:hypothetical protein
MKNCFGMHGWKEFHRNRKNIIDEYDRIYEITENRPVRTAHGVGVEAYLRKWITEFLPKKWAITSGYIIPTLYKESPKLYHYDIIIYDALNAPVLWTEGNEDDSDQGKYRAIPAKYVACVLEVKSRLNPKNIKDMANKLSELKAVSEQLPNTFFSSGIFVDLKDMDNTKLSVLSSVHEFNRAHRFMEAMVLRYEGDVSATGIVRLHKIDVTDKTDRQFDRIAKPIDNLAIYMTEDGNVEIAEGGGGVIAVASSNSSWSMSKTFSAMHQVDDLLANITWSRNGFSEFCIDLISSLEGLSLTDEHRPSFGRIFDSFKQKPTEIQPSSKVEGMPFINITLNKLESGAEVEVVDTESSLEISFAVMVKNEGDTEAEISDDHFKTKVTLPPGKKGVKSCKVKAIPKDKQKDIDEIRNMMDSEGFLIPYRIAYFPTDGEKVFYAIEKNIRVFNDRAAFDDE